MENLIDGFECLGLAGCTMWGLQHSTRLRVGEVQLEAGAQVVDGLAAAVARQPRRRHQLHSSHYALRHAPRLHMGR